MIVRTLLPMLVLALPVASCDRPSAATTPHPPLGPAALRMQAATIRGLAPPGTYHCSLRDPDAAAAEEAVYGDLIVNADAYRLVAADGHAFSGVLHSTPAGQLIWNGALGAIDAAPRHVSRAQVTAGEDTISLVFDFAPATAGQPPRTQAVCRMSIGADI